MESNKWLWQPHADGPIYLRLSYRDLQGRRRFFVRSLRTNHWPSARRTRDAEFMPIILDMDQARAKHDLIHALYPELEQKLGEGVRGGYKRRATSPALMKLLEEYGAALSSPGNYQASDRTAKRYAGICKRFAVAVGQDRPIDGIASKDVVGYRDRRLEEEGASKKTVDLELIAVRGMFAFAVERHGLASNPAEGVSVKRTKAERNREKRLHKRRPPTQTEADALCSLVPPHHRRYSAEDFQDFAMLARYTGMRQGEIAQLHCEDFQLYPSDAHGDRILSTPTSYEKAFQGDTVDGHVPCIYLVDRADRTIKTGLERIVPIADKLLPVVRRRLESGGGTGPLFPFAAGDRGTSFGRWWLKKAKSVDQDLTMHGFRHYAASEMENGGVSEAVSSLILGHVRSDVHSGYVHTEVILLKQGVEKIP